MGTDLGSLERAARKATPGPWRTDDQNCAIVVCSTGYIAEAQSIRNDEHDAFYISLADPQTILAMIAELRQARAERDWLVGKLGRGYDRWTTCPNREIQKQCEGEPSAEDCYVCWLNAAREAVEGKK